MELCKLANVPIIRGVDNKVLTFRMEDIKCTKNDSKFEIQVHKPPVYET